MKKIKELYKLFDNNDIMNDVCSNSKKPPKILYHYTNEKGLKGLIESGYFHATHFLSLNDPTEIKYSIDITKEILEDFIRNEKDLVIRDNLDKTLQFDFISRFNDQGFIYDVYVACFTENGDLPSQWKRYADKGMGYSIGIDHSKFPNKIDGLEDKKNLYLNNSINLIKVEYNPDIQRKKIKYSFGKKITEIKNFIKADKNNKDIALIHINEIITKLQSIISLLFKNPKYKKENEWRFLYYCFPFNNDEKAKFELLGNNIKHPSIVISTKKNELIRYLKMDFRNIDNNQRVPLKEIVIGPKQNVIKVKKAIDIFLKQKGYNGIEIPKILKSTISFENCEF